MQKHGQPLLIGRKGKGLLCRNEEKGREGGSAPRAYRGFPAESLLLLLQWENHRRGGRKKKEELFYLFLWGKPPKKGLPPSELEIRCPFIFYRKKPFALSTPRVRLSSPPGRKREGSSLRSIWGEKKEGRTVSSSSICGYEHHPRNKKGGISLQGRRKKREGEDSLTCLSWENLFRKKAACFPAEKGKRKRGRGPYLRWPAMDIAGAKQTVDPLFPGEGGRRWKGRQSNFAATRRKERGEREIVIWGKGKEEGKTPRRALERETLP